MKNILVPLDGISKKAFTLVELLVVITILAIISVVAYQNFGGAVDKAVSGRKISDVSTIETSLQQYKVDNNYYPATSLSGGTNLWGYDKSKTATPSNTIRVTMDGAALSGVTLAEGGGRIYGTGTWATKQIGAKGTITQAILGKKYLTKDLYDPELGDVKINGGKLSDKGIGRYIYATFKKPLSGDTTWGIVNKKGLFYNIAYTIKENGTDKYKTKIVGDYDSESCYSDKTKCPDTLIGSGTTILNDGDLQSSSNTLSNNQGIPYPLADFSE